MYNAYLAKGERLYPHFKIKTSIDTSYPTLTDNKGDHKCTI